MVSRTMPLRQVEQSLLPLKMISNVRSGFLWLTQQSEIPFSDASQVSGDF
jgi:hypothetical protein